VTGAIRRVYIGASVVSVSCKMTSDREDGETVKDVCDGIEVNMSAPVTLSDLERRDAKSQIFPEDLRKITLVPLDLERPNIACNGGASFTRSVTPRPKRRGPEVQWLKWSCEAGGTHLTKPGWSKPHTHSTPN